MDPDRGERESAALSALSSSARRLRTFGLVPGILLGVVALLPTFWLLTELQWLVMDSAFVLVSGGGAAGTLFLCILCGRWVGERLWRARRPGLTAALARQHGLELAEVDELAGILSSA